MKLSKIINKIEQFYPQSLKEDWDNVGLQLGSESKDVNKVLTALEITDEVIEEAIEYEIDLIVVHHPLFFKKITSLCEDEVHNKKITKLIKNDIAVYAIHTNIDIAPNGINDWLCEILEISDTKILKKTCETNMYSIHITLDMENIDIILDLLPKIGIGKQVNDKEEQFIMLPKIKNYKDPKTQVYKTKDVTVIETHGTKEQIELLKRQLYKLKNIHKIYTKISYFLIEDYTISFGLGRVGYIKPKSLEMLAEQVKNTFQLKKINIVGSRETIIKKVGIIGGSGSSLIKDAKYNKCDVLITGDIGFHDAQYAKDLGICLIDATHYMEVVFNDGMAEFLKLIENLEVMSSNINTNPFEVE